VFKDGQQDKFETGFKHDRNSASKGSDFAAEFHGLENSMQPDAAILREFGLPVPIEDF